MEPLSFRKIGELSSETRLAASWGPKIAQIGSLARWKMFPAILGRGRVLRFIVFARPWGPESPKQEGPKNSSK